MILPDTSIWIAHMRDPMPELSQLLETGNVLIHSMIIGEIACGTIHARMNFLSYLQSLPRIGELAHDQVLQEIETGGFMGRGIGYIDAHLLTSVMAQSGAALWTRDQRLKRIAEEMGVVFPVGANHGQS